MNGDNQVVDTTEDVGMEQELPSLEELYQYQADAEKTIEDAQKMQKLMMNEDFNYLFNDIFINSWAITQTHNAGKLKPEQRERVMERMIARGHFSDFCMGIINDGKMAVDNLAQIKADIKTQEESSEV
jgi:hypothetical protein